MRMEAVEGWTRCPASPQALVPEARRGVKKSGHLEPSEGPRGASSEKKAESRLPSAKGTQNAVWEGQAPLSLSHDAAAPHSRRPLGTGGGLDAPLTAGQPQPNTVLSNSRKLHRAFIRDTAKYLKEPTETLKSGVSTDFLLAGTQRTTRLYSRRPYQLNRRKKTESADSTQGSGGEADMMPPRVHMYLPI